jgi:hypothetical protein
MSHLFNLLGVNTLEMIRLGNEKSPAKSWGLMDHEGPVIDLRQLCGRPRKLVWLPRELLERLYQRFAETNPKGTRIVMGGEYEAYTPPGLTEEDIERLSDEGKLFNTITNDRDMNWHYPRLCELLPELKQPETLARLETDPALDVALMARAREAGAISNVYGDRHKRWSTAWQDYVTAYKKKQPAQAPAD